MRRKNSRRSSAGSAREAVLRRPRLPRKAVEAAVGRFETSVTAVLEREFATLSTRARYLDNLSAPVREQIAADPRALASGKALYRIEQRAHERRTAAIQKGISEEPAMLFNFTADPGWQMLGPPYDVAWQTGAGFADRLDGKMWAIIGDGFSAAAVGVFLSITTRSLVRFRPIAPYNYDWGNLAIRGPAASSGGVGVVGYVNNGAQPLVDKHGPLWADARVPPQSANGSGTGHLADRLWGDVLIVMEPGNTYLLWTWIYGMGRMSDNEDRLSLSLAQISGRVGAIVVDAGPVPVIR